MLTLHNTSNLDRIEISGDPQDLNALCSSLRTIVGDEEEYTSHDGRRLIVLSLCSDLRHAIQSEVEAEHTDNVMNSDRIRMMEMTTPVENVTCKCHINYIEAMFVTIFLNDFIRRYARKRAKTSRFPLLNEKNQWDKHIATVRLFQSLMVNCMEEAVKEDSFERLLNLMHKGLSKD